MSGLFSCVAMNTEWQAFEPGRADLWGEVMGRSLAKVWSIVALLLVAVLSGGRSPEPGRRSLRQAPRVGKATCKGQLTGSWHSSGVMAPMSDSAVKAIPA